MMVLNILGEFEFWKFDAQLIFYLIPPVRMPSLARAICKAAVARVICKQPAASLRMCPSLNQLYEH